MNSESVRRPAPVRAAFALYLGAAAVAMVGAVVRLALGADGSVLLTAILEGNALLWLGAAMRAGRRWARLALAGLAAILVVSGARAILVGAPAVELSSRAAEVALLVAATAAMFLPGAGHWFAGRDVPGITTAKE